MYFRIPIAIALAALAMLPAVVRSDDAPVDKQMLYKQLEQTLTGAKFVGRFTVTGRDDGKLTPEEYTIVSATKVEQGEMWLLNARIKYGDKDLVIPMPLEILWAGKTPVITLDKVSLPGLGTFSARVVIGEGRYAGTWQHDKVGGHLFGTIMPGEAKPSKSTE